MMRSTEISEMTENAALARRLMRYEGFRWLPGMYCCTRYAQDGETEHGRVVYIDGDGWPRFAGDEYASFPGECCPLDLTDPATAGCLLALLHATGAEFHIEAPAADSGIWCCWLVLDGSATAFSESHLGIAVASALWGFYSAV